MPSNSRVSDWQRSWLSIWVVIHFFIFTICLVHNNGSSFLIRRVYELTAPYSIALQQDYGARSLEMTTGFARSWPHQLQIHKRQTSDAQWQFVQPESLPIMQQLDVRWKNFQHMLAVAASEENEELIYGIFDQIALRCMDEGLDIDGVRLMRTATLSSAQNKLYRNGQLPAEALNDAVLYEARVVSMPDHQLKLLPVLERARRAVSMEETP